MLAAMMGMVIGVAVPGQYYDGQDLHELWEASKRRVAGVPDAGADKFDKSYLSGYVIGTADAMAGINLFCPGSAKAGQLVAVVGKYLDDHPEEWNKAGSYLVAVALKEAFPCGKK